MQGKSLADSRQEFRDSASDVDCRLKLVTNHREGIEIFHTAEYENFLKFLLPEFEKHISESEPQYIDGPENRIRFTILEIINRLPNNEILRSYVPGILDLSMDILLKDNEHNGVIATRIVFELYKNFSPPPETHAVKFLDFFTDLYKDFSSIADNLFSIPVLAQTSMHDLSDDVVSTTSIPKASSSLKVLAECPLIVMLLFQVFPKFVEERVALLITLMIHALKFTAPKPKEETNPHVYSDFITVQVKTMSFLTYVLRGYAEIMAQHEDTIAHCVIELLRQCPGNSMSSRRELLVATRHILATSFRKGFLKELDAMLDERLLIGTGCVAHNLIRPLAYSTLAELVHYVRSNLTMSQLFKVVYIFSKNLQDHSLPFNLKNASIRLILNLVNVIHA
eukprot:263840_1